MFPAFITCPCHSVCEQVYYRIKSKSSNVDYHPFSMVDSATSRASIAAKPTPYTAKAASVSFKAVPNAPSS